MLNPSIESTMTRSDQLFNNTEFKPRMNSVINRKLSTEKSDDKKEKTGSHESNTEMFQVIDSEYNADDVFFENNRALLDDFKDFSEQKQRKRKVTQVKKLSQAEMMEKAN